MHPTTTRINRMLCWEEMIKFGVLRCCMYHFLFTIFVALFSLKFHCYCYVQVDCIFYWMWALLICHCCYEFCPIIVLSKSHMDTFISSLIALFFHILSFLKIDCTIVVILFIPLLLSLKWCWTYFHVHWLIVLFLFIIWLLLICYINIYTLLILLLGFFQ